MNFSKSTHSLLAVQDGKANAKQWNDTCTMLLHELLPTLPRPQTGTGEFSKWVKMIFNPACVGSASILRKFMPQTMFHKVNAFYDHRQQDPHEALVVGAYGSDEFRPTGQLQRAQLAVQDVGQA